MGYITQFQLRIVPHSYPLEVVGAAFAKATNSDNIDYEISYIQALVDGDVEGKWYSFDDDMKALSKELPDVLFRLAGVGEEQGDEWVSFYLNGEVETHRRQNWNPPNFPTETIEWTAEKREKAKAGQQEHYDRIKAAQNERAEARKRAEKEAAAAEIQALAAKAGVEVIVKGVGE